jgi:transcriptional regulator with XRE-family HTH domain
MARDKTGKTGAKATKAVAGSIGSLGDYLKEQRLAARLSLRQLADQVGVSNPYLSQIERGLRKPSAEVLQQLARALRVSAEQLYVRAGIVHPDPGQPGSVELAILADTGLTERQKNSLLDVYASFLALNNHPEPSTTAPSPDSPE